MEQKILDHYLQYGLYTNPGFYAEYLKSLPNDIRKIGHLLRWSFIHRTTLDWGNTSTNTDLKFGDMKKVPWYRQAEDDNLTNTVSMLAELFRRDSNGLTLNRKVKDKVILTCRHISVLMASILKAKGIPARVRSGFAPYFQIEGLHVEKSSDHWINQYWDKENNRWITIDVDGSFHDIGLDLYDIPDGKFDYAADAWLSVRKGKIPEDHFVNADGNKGLVTIAWELFYDFHCLMNNEIIYLHHPHFVTLREFRKISREKLNEIDLFAELMQHPDENFNKLQKIWNANKEYRLLKGGLL